MYLQQNLLHGILKQKKNAASFLIARFLKLKIKSFYHFWLINKYKWKYCFSLVFMTDSQ